MLLFTIVAFIVYLAYNNDVQHIYRLSILSLSLIAYIAWEALTVQYTSFTIFNDWFKYTPDYAPIALFIIILIITMLFYPTIKHRYLNDNKWIPLIILINLAGLLLLPISNDILALYLIIELQSYSLYIITCIYNRAYGSTKAAAGYFAVGAFASTILLYGIVAIYRETSLTTLSEIWNYYLIQGVSTPFPWIFILGALVIKLGLAPFHAWTIGVYVKTPTYITMYISIVAKLSIMGFIFINMGMIYTPLLYLVFYLSLAVGAIAPLYNVNIKAILAYSGILNFAYILIAAIQQDEAFFIYLIQYGLTHVLIFICILSIGNSIKVPSSVWSPILNVNQLVTPNIQLNITLIICLLSLIGIPPLPGFYGKYYILVSLIDSGQVVEAISIIIASVIATYYYAFIIKQLASNLTKSWYNHLSVNDKFILLNKDLPYTISLYISLILIILLSYYMILPTLLEGFALLIE
uniref:NADH-ubiquinone oxidoreductase chain 2 n=1 Tax=Candida buenavistaensis TaxID=434039 RepID=S5TDV5_9ASCO|nr:NADH dehydrogenase subunit 2 [Candida buenavistaensis]AGS44064.1 NADH dehydrogenase subunit 2 [Candida buenavistaensis]